MGGRPSGKTRKAATETPAFSFSAGLLQYANKAEYSANKTVFSVIALEYQPQRGFNGTDRWAATVAHADGKTFEIVTLPANDKRNAQLHAAKAEIEQRGPLSNLILVRSGSAYYIRSAEARTL
jgi:hypothetical protein